MSASVVWVPAPPPDHLFYPVCLDVFNQPVLLPACGHTLCRACLRTALAAQRACPCCRTLVHPSVRADALSLNWSLQTAVAALRVRCRFFAASDKEAGLVQGCPAVLALDAVAAHEAACVFGAETSDSAAPPQQTNDRFPFVFSAGRLASSHHRRGRRVAALVAGAGAQPLPAAQESSLSHAAALSHVGRTTYPASPRVEHAQSVCSWSAVRRVDVPGLLVRLDVNTLCLSRTIPFKFLRACFSPDGRTVAHIFGNTVELVAVATGRRRALGAEPDQWLRCCAFSPDATTLAVGGLQGHGALCSLFCGPDLREHYVSVSGHLRLIDVSSGCATLAFAGHTDEVLCCAFSPCGRTLASGSADSYVRLHDAATGVTVAALSGHDRNVWSVAFAPDGATLVSGGSDGLMQVWEVEAPPRSLVATLRGHIFCVSCVAVSPDGRTILSSADDNTLRLWAAASGMERLQIPLAYPPECVAFSPCGRWIVSGGEDPGLRVWDAATGACLGRVGSSRRGHHSVAFSPDGNTVAATDDGGVLTIWAKRGPAG